MLRIRHILSTFHPKTTSAPTVSYCLAFHLEKKLVLSLLARATFILRNLHIVELKQFQIERYLNLVFSLGNEIREAYSHSSLSGMG